MGLLTVECQHAKQLEEVLDLDRKRACLREHRDIVFFEVKGTDRLVSQSGRLEG